MIKPSSLEWSYRDLSGNQNVPWLPRQGRGFPRGCLPSCIRRLIKDLGTMNVCLRQSVFLQFSAIPYGRTVTRFRDDAAKIIPNQKPSNKIASSRMRGRSFEMTTHVAFRTTMVLRRIDYQVHQFLCGLERATRSMKGGRTCGVFLPSGWQGYISAWETGNGRSRHARR